MTETVTSAEEASREAAAFPEADSAAVAAEAGSCHMRINETKKGAFRSLRFFAISGFPGSDPEAQELRKCRLS